MNSSTQDINIYESGSGGEMSILNNDLRMTESLCQTVYLALFGGNIEASTIGNEIKGEQRFDWWGNSLLFNEKKAKQFNSETEKALKNNTINSLGASRIKTAVENDLVFLKKITDIDVNIVILSFDKIQIEIKLKALSNQTDKSLQFVWDNSKNVVITNQTI